MAMDKMEAHLRQQLSAMMDGELARTSPVPVLAPAATANWPAAGALAGRACAAARPGRSPAAGGFRNAWRARWPRTRRASRRPAIAATGTHSRRWVVGGGAALAALAGVAGRGAICGLRSRARHRSAVAADPDATRPRPLSPQPAAPRFPASPSTPLQAARVGWWRWRSPTHHVAPLRRCNRAPCPVAGRAPPPAVVEAATKASVLPPLIRSLRWNCPGTPILLAAGTGVMTVAARGARFGVGGASPRVFDRIDGPFYPFRTGNLPMPGAGQRPATVVPEPRWTPAAPGRQTRPTHSPNLPTFVPSEVDSRCPSFIHPRVGAATAAATTLVVNPPTVTAQTLFGRASAQLVANLPDFTGLVSRSGRACERGGDHRRARRAHAQQARQGHANGRGPDPRIFKLRPRLPDAGMPGGPAPGGPTTVREACRWAAVSSFRPTVT